MRDATPIAVGTSAGSRTQITTGFMTGDVSNDGAALNMGAGVVTFFDAPSSSSAITYDVQVATNDSTVFVNRTSTDTDSAATLHGRATSTITLMEVAV